MEQTKFLVSPAPHATAKPNTRLIMAGVCVALLPTLVAATIIFGWRALLLTAVTTGACVGFEALYCILMKKPLPVGDLSAVVTGLILAFNLPPTLPLWMALIGAFVAIIITKQLFGGIGANFANPALVGRMVLQLSFTGPMINYVYPQSTTAVDVLASATPLAAMQQGHLPMIDMLLGTHAGTLGETCAITLIIGGIFLIATKIISPIIPAVYIGGVFLFKLVLNFFAAQNAGEAVFSVIALDAGVYLLGGGLLLGAFFMATDYATSPYTRSGKVVFGIGLALLTVLMREWSSMLEGVSYALLLMNLLVPFINDFTRQRPLGVTRSDKKARKGVA